MRYFDTAPLYGHGLSELRLGQNLRWKTRDEFVVSSKVGRLLKPAPRASIDFTPWVDGAPFTFRFDYSYDGAMRSLEDTLQRMAIERIDIAFIHDCDVFTHGAAQQKIYFKQAMKGAYKALLKMREEGVVKAIGFGVNEWQVCHEALKQGDFDGFLLAGRYTLLEQDSLDEFLPLCEKRNAAVVIGGGLNSGILATGAVPGAKYNYSPAPAPIMEKVKKIEVVCAEHNVPLPAAALAIPAGASGHRLACAGNPDGSADGAEYRLDQPSDPEGVLAGAEAQGPPARGCARPYLMTRTLARSIVTATAATRMKPKTIC